MSLPEEVVGVEMVPDRDAIRDGNAHLAITKVWGMVDLSHRGSLAKQGLVAVPDGRLVLAFPVNDETMSMTDLKKLMQGLMDSFGGSWSALVEFLEPSDF
jgi:hypothetical protein